MNKSLVNIRNTKEISQAEFHTHIILTSIFRVKGFYYIMPHHLPGLYISVHVLCGGSYLVLCHTQSFSLRFGRVGHRYIHNSCCVMVFRIMQCTHSDSDSDSMADSYHSGTSCLVLSHTRSFS